MRVLVVHNRYRSAQPSGENAVVEEETALLRAAGVVVDVLSVESDDIAGWPAVKRLTLPGRVVWSREGARTVRRAIAGFRPDVVHFHNTFPLLSPAALRAAHGERVRVVQTLHNFRPLCPAATFLRGVASARTASGASRSQRSSTAATDPRASPRSRSP